MIAPSPSVLKICGSPLEGGSVGCYVVWWERISRSRKAAPSTYQKDTYVVLNALWGYGDLGQHADGQEVDVGVAISAAVTLQLNSRPY